MAKGDSNQHASPTPPRACSVGAHWAPLISSAARSRGTAATHIGAEEEVAQRWCVMSHGHCACHGLPPCSQGCGLHGHGRPLRPGRAS